MTRNYLALAVAGLLGSAISTTALAGITVYKDGDKYVKVGGRIQMQYHQGDPDVGDTTDELFFRRFRPYIEGSLHKDWMGKFQWDMGKATGDNEIAIKDAYMQYKGVKNMKITLGNANFPFSRELITSSKYQQLTERTFVGDHDYGTPDRQLGLHMTGNNDGKTMTWGASLAQAHLDPDQDKLDFDTAVNTASDFNEGWMVGGRVDFHPFGLLKFSQGDFSGDKKATIGVAAFSWSNDEDNNTRTNAAGIADDDPDTAPIDATTKPDVDSVTGYEISGAFRAGGLSVDAEYNKFSVDTTDGTFTGGIFKGGNTDLTNYAVEGGYMIVPDRLELVAGHENQDADGYADKWTRTSIGANWFLKKHDVKFQFTYRMGENLKGKKNSDENELFVQAQYVF